MTAQDLIAFETGIKELWEAGELPCLLHLGGGNEEQLLAIFKDINTIASGGVAEGYANASSQPGDAPHAGSSPAAPHPSGDWVFSTHRNHYHALLAGIPPDDVKAKILNGRSMFAYSSKHNFFCSAVLAGCAGIAAGVAWVLRNEDHGIPIHYRPKHVWCFIGDGGEEQGHFYEAAMFVEANELPCTFIIEDNNRSVDTPRDLRRGNAKGLEHLFKCVRRYEYTPTYPHAGSGCTFQIEFKKDAIERMKPRATALRSPGEGGFLGSLAEHPHPDAFHHATALPYGGDCGRKTSDLLKGT